MLNIPIESEIEQEHKVIKGFTMRQVVCIGVVLGFAVLMYVLTLNWIAMVIFTLPLVAVALWLMKENDNGKKSEEIFLISMQRKIYKNDKRRYRTKNSYVRLMNSAYGDIRRQDAKDKNYAKKVKKKQKEIENKKKISKIKPIF